MARVALVTGGTRGIGAEISRALKEANRTVVATYATNDKAALTFSDETGIKVYKFDVCNFDKCKFIPVKRDASCEGCLDEPEHELCPLGLVGADAIDHARAIDIHRNHQLLQAGVRGTKRIQVNHRAVFPKNAWCEFPQLVEAPTTCPEELIAVARLQGSPARLGQPIAVPG